MTHSTTENREKEKWSRSFSHSHSEWLCVSAVVMHPFYRLLLSSMHRNVNVNCLCSYLALYAILNCILFEYRWCRFTSFSVQLKQVTLVNIPIFSWPNLRLHFSWVLLAVIPKSNVYINILYWIYIRKCFVLSKRVVEWKIDREVDVL